MARYGLVVVLIFVLMLGAIFVQRLYRRFALQNPELGPFRSESGGCGGHCGSGACAGSRCDASAQRQAGPKTLNGVQSEPW